jgi:hypothetical protein
MSSSSRFAGSITSSSSNPDERQLCVALVLSRGREVGIATIDVDSITTCELASIMDNTQETAVAAFTDPLFFALTACVMDRVPVTAKDVLPLRYEVDWVKVFTWT